MGLLLDERFDLWAVVEVEREIGSAVVAADSLNRLHRAGLVHLVEERAFVKASRAAQHFHGLEL